MLFYEAIGYQQASRRFVKAPLLRNNLIARPEGTIYEGMVTSVLTGCLTFRDKRKFWTRSHVVHTNTVSQR
jgi:hypothetical protein